MLDKEENHLTATKSNNLIDAGFFKKLNSVEMRIVNLAISHLNPLRPIDQNRRFEFSVQEFLTFNTGLTNKNHAYESIQTAVKNLGKTWVPIQATDGYDVTEISLLTERSYSKGKGRFMIEFNPKAMPYLVEIKNNYTSILLETFGMLKSEYSLKLYEILSRWAYKGSVQISVVTLKSLLDVSDNYERWNNFNQRVLAPALKEISTKTNLLVSLKTHRTGRAITDLEFIISNKTDAIDVSKRPKFPHKNKYGRFVRLDPKSPRNSSHEFGLWARDCLKVLENFYTNIDLIPKEDLLNYWIFLSIDASNTSKLGNKKAFADTLQKMGYRIVECELKKIT